MVSLVTKLNGVLDNVRSGLIDNVHYIIAMSVHNHGMKTYDVYISTDGTDPNKDGSYNAVVRVECDGIASLHWDTPNAIVAFRTFWITGIVVDSYQRDDGDLIGSRILGDDIIAFSISEDD